VNDGSALLHRVPRLHSTRPLRRALTNPGRLADEVNTQEDAQQFGSPGSVQIRLEAVEKAGDAERFVGG